jgi:hypothetical protein
VNYGIENGVMREPAQVIMPLPENWTKILLLRTYGVGLADGGIYWDIPTEVIPLAVRLIGCRFVITTKLVLTLDQFQHGREAWQEVQIEEIPEGDKSRWPECNRLKPFSG